MRRAFVTFAISILILLTLVACAPPVLDDSNQAESPTDQVSTTEGGSEPVAESSGTDETGEPGLGMGGTMRGSMMRFHHATIPAGYSQLSNPIAADDESLARGAELYNTNCASCHGTSGLGDGAAGVALNPPPSPIAHTSQMMSDAYLFWRISEGGIEFATAMPAWATVLDENERWDVINYVRSLLAGGGMGPGPMRGRQGQGPGMGQMDEAEHHAAMLAEAVEKGLISDDDAALFQRVHDIVDAHYRPTESGMDDMTMRGKQVMQRALTGQAVRDGAITQEDADRFTQIHDILLESGIMQ